MHGVSDAIHLHKYQALPPLQLASPDCVPFVVLLQKQILPAEPAQTPLGTVKQGLPVKQAGPLPPALIFLISSRLSIFKFFIKY